MGLARRNLENLEREKTVRILQWFSFKFDDVKMMMTNLKPEVKNANGVNIFQVFTSEKTILNWEVLQKPRMCTGTLTAARKKSERRNAWECRFLDSAEVQCENNENAKKWSLACVLRTPDFMKFVIKNETMLLAWVLHIMKLWISMISKIGFPRGTSEKIDNHWKSIDGSKNFNVASSSRRMLFMRCNEDPCSFIKEKWKLIEPRPNVTYIRISLNLRR